MVNVATVPATSASLSACIWSMAWQLRQARVGGMWRNPQTWQRLAAKAYFHSSERCTVGRRALGVRAPRWLPVHLAAPGQERRRRAGRHARPRPVRPPSARPPRHRLLCGAPGSVGFRCAGRSASAPSASDSTAITCPGSARSSTSQSVTPTCAAPRFPAVGADVGTVASSVDRPLPAMAIAAQRADRPKPEGVPVALMRRIMIGDRRRRDAVLREAKGAERLDPKLMASALSPSLQAVPIPPGERLRGLGDRSGQDVKGSRLGSGSRTPDRAQRAVLSQHRRHSRPPCPQERLRFRTVGPKRRSSTDSLTQAA